MTFFLAFLGVPLAIFVIFVLIPFGQAIFWGMTDWRGFSPDYNFVGFDNFTKMFQDDIFLKALRNVALLAAFVPLVTLTLALGVAVVLGLWNGALVAVLGIQPIVATLILMTAGRGIAMLITEGQILTVNSPPFKVIGSGFLFGIPVPVLIAVSAVTVIASDTVGFSINSTSALPPTRTPTPPRCAVPMPASSAFNVYSPGERLMKRKLP